MVRRCTLFALVLLLLLIALRAETIEHAGTTYWVHRVDPTVVAIELHLAPEAGKPNTFPQLEARLASRGRRLLFAMNAGIFEPNFLPTGLHIADGKTIVPLNLDDYQKRHTDEPTPNFFLKPNGVFYLRSDRSPAIVESRKFATLGEKPILATQSGPLLVEAGKIHPVLQPESTSRRTRNGVGVTEAGEVIFVCSVSDRTKGLSNLYRFAELFRDRLACPNALYLDGDISHIHLHGITGPLEETNWFAGLFAITDEADR